MCFKQICLLILIVISEEIICLDKESPLPTLKKNGGYSSCDEFLGFLFQLEREDCLFPLRHAVQTILHKRISSSEANVYSVTFRSIVVNDSHKLSFSSVVLIFNLKSFSRSRISPMMFGSLLAFSIDGNFQTLFFATVVCHEKSVLAVEICSGDKANVALKLMNSKSILALQSPIYYRTHMPVMRSLQQMQSVPFESELIEQCAPDNAMPTLLELTIDASEAFPLFDFLTCESDKSLFTFLNCVESSDVMAFKGKILDSSQKSAIKHALTNRVALIQGPPGNLVSRKYVIFSIYLMYCD